MFLYLAQERNLLCLGLYRLENSSDNKHPYVYTNPDRETILTHRDKVFVLAYNMPLDICNFKILVNISKSKENEHF